MIHADSLKNLEGNDDYSVGHIGTNGALRLAKALWWMLARLAGWDGGVVDLPNKVYLPLVSE